jgi:hypothetical protein
MKCTACVATISLALGSLAILADRAMAQDHLKPSPWADTSKIKINYEMPGAALRPIYDTLHQRKVLERLQRFLSPLLLKSDIEVKAAECGVPADGRFYSYVPYERGKPVIICYEYVQLIEKLAPEKTDKSESWGVVGQALVSREMALSGPFVQEILHDVALAALDQLEIPIWGKVEDAADNVAAFIMMQFGTDVALKTVLGTAYFLKEANKLIVTKKDKNGKPVISYDYDYLGDIRPPMLQRYYNLLCMAVGKDKVAFSTLIAVNRDPTELEFTWEHALDCGEDYQKVLGAFKQTILDKHVDQGLLAQLKAIDWLADP